MMAIERLLAKLNELSDKDGNPEELSRLRKEVVNRSRGLVKSIALEFTNSGEDLEDLVQAGYIGLLNAVASFEPSRNAQFFAYASRVIREEIRHYIRDKHAPTKNTDLPEEKQDMPVSAAYLAQQAGVRRGDIHYWARKGFIERRADGGKTPYYLHDLPKIRLMQQIIEGLKLEAKHASALADKILKLYQARPEQYEAAVNLVEMFIKSFDVLTEILVELGFNNALKELRTKNNTLTQQMKNIITGNIRTRIEKRVPILSGYAGYHVVAWETGTNKRAEGWGSTEDEARRKAIANLQNKLTSE